MGDIPLVIDAGVNHMQVRVYFVIGELSLGEAEQDDTFCDLLL